MPAVPTVLTLCTCRSPSVTSARGVRGRTELLHYESKNGGDILIERAPGHTRTASVCYRSPFPFLLTCTKLATETKQPRATDVLFPPRPRYESRRQTGFGREVILFKRGICNVSCVSLAGKQSLVNCSVCRCCTQSAERLAPLR